jgi:hypothetical protein
MNMRNPVNRLLAVAWLGCNVWSNRASAVEQAPPAVPAGVTLVRDGIPQALIVLPSDPAGQEISGNAARMLSDHLFLMSGARLAIKREAELGHGTVAGGCLAFEPGKVPTGISAFVLVGEGETTRAMGHTSEGLGAGGILVKTEGNVLTLLGPAATPADRQGTRHAVIEFLETLGVRQLWPGETGRVLPRTGTLIAGPLDIRFTPPIGQRNIRFAALGDRAATGLTRLQLSQADWSEASQAANAMELGCRFEQWHRLGGNIGVGGGHAGAGLAGGWKEHGSAHPEWFALQADGTRDQSAAGDRWRLCKSNPELIACVADTIIERVKADPKLTCISLSPNDGGYSSFCMCETCKKLDPTNAPPILLMVMAKVGQSDRREIPYVALTDRMVWYWNQIAERVTRVHPDMLFLGEAYSYFSTPPVREKLHPNLVLRYVPSSTNDWLGWQDAGAKRIYWRPNILLSGRRNGTLHVMLQRLADTMEFMSARGMLATDFDSIIYNWAVHGLNYYATAKLAWNPLMTADAILDSYCTPGFGKGADSITRYFLLAQKVVATPEASYTPAAIAELRRLLQQADQAADGDEPARERIAFLRMGLNFTELQMVLDDLNRQAGEGNVGALQERAKPLLELNYFTLRDIVRHHNRAINVGYILWGNGDYAGWSAIGGRGYRPARERLDQVEREQRQLTGRENSLDEMRAALGLDVPLAVPAGAVVPGATPDMVMETDEQGRPAELPTR